MSVSSSGSTEDPPGKKNMSEAWSGSAQAPPGKDMSVSYSGSTEVPPGKQSTSPTAGAYTGYKLKSEQVFVDDPYENVSFRKNFQTKGPGGAQKKPDGERQADTDKLMDSAGTDGVAVGALGLFLICFLVTIVFAVLAATCKMGLCNVKDKSTSTFNFSVPMQYALAALSACFLACAAMEFKTLQIVKQDVGTPYMVDMATRIREGSHSFLIVQLTCAVLLSAIAIGPIWASSDWRVVICFIGGLVCAATSSFIGVAITTRGNLRTAAATAESLSIGVALCYKTGSVVSLSMHAFGLGGVSLCYLLFRDVRALVGFVAGTSIVALVSRFSGGIFAKAAETGTDFAGKIEAAIPEDDPRNPGTISSGVGGSIGNVSGMGTDFLESLVGCVVATAILGAALPYFENNAYALCVANHLSIDKMCVSSAPAAPNLQTSIAAAICRQGNKYLEYPELKTSQGISIFVALPFIIGMIGLLASTLVSFRIPNLAEEYELEEDNAGGVSLPSRVLATSRILRSMQINTIIASCIVLIGSAITCFTMFGASSAFSAGLDAPDPGGRLPRYELKRSRGAKDLCSTVFLGQDADTTKFLVPDGRFVNSTYKPLDSFGRKLPPAKEISWRLFLCTLLGLILGLVILAVTSYFIDQNFSPTRLTARSGKLGAGAVLVAGAGTGFISTVAPLLFIVTAILSCDSLYGSYGVGIATISMLSILGVTVSAIAFGPVASNAKAVTEMAALPAVARHRAYVLESAGNTNAATGRGLSAASAILTAYVIVSAIVNESGLAPSPIALINGQFDSTNPIRHISEVESLVSLDSGVFLGVVSGLFIPFLFASLILAATSRSMYMIIDEIRNQFDSSPELLSGDITVSPDSSTCVDRAGRNALLETIAPAIVAGLVPLSIGFGLGQRALVGFLLALIGSGYLLSAFMTTAGGTWENAMRLVESGEFGEENAMGSDWHLASFACHSLGTSFKDAAGPSMNVLFKFMTSVAFLAVAQMAPGESGQWWIGLLLLVSIVLTLLVFSTCLQRRRERIHIEMTTASTIPSPPIGDTRTVSPFYSSGPEIRADSLAPGSMLGREYRALSAEDVGREDIERRGALALPAYKID